MYMLGYHNDFGSFHLYHSLSTISARLATLPPGQFMLIGAVPECKEYYHAGAKDKRDTWTFFDNEPEAIRHRDKYLGFYSLRELFLYRVPATTDTIEATDDNQTEPAAPDLGAEAAHPSVREHGYPSKATDFGPRGSNAKRSDY